MRGIWLLIFYRGRIADDNMSALLNFESLLAYGIWVSINLKQVNVGVGMVRKDLQLYCMVKLWMMAKNGECANRLKYVNSYA